MPRLDNNQFITELSKLFLSCRESGSVFLTMKTVYVRPDGRVVLPGRKIPADAQPCCLLRATDGADADKKVKLSTIVSFQDLPKFQPAFNAVVSSNTDNLKKKEKKKKSKKKQRVV